MYPNGNRNVAHRPIKGIDSAKIMADADPGRKIRDAIDPPHMRELRRQQDRLAESADRIREALGSGTDFPGVISVVDRYRSPVRDALDVLRARDPLQETASRIRSGVLPARPSSSTTNSDSVRSAADIGRRVREARRAMGMTQQRFADVAGVGRRFLVELERGKPSLEIGRVLAVCQAAGLRLAFAK